MDSYNNTIFPRVLNFEKYYLIFNQKDLFKNLSYYNY